jgi:prepilin-type N-terminal cleavage/methylation domain-containing protein
MQYKTSPGFTLVEVIVVMVIVAILATGVVFMFSNPNSKVKGQTFTLLGDLNRARSEAVSENIDVGVSFRFGTIDGYSLWFDEDEDSSYTAGTDTLILERDFPKEVQYYDSNVTDGPNIKPLYFPQEALNMEDGGTDDDGVEFDGDNEFLFTSRGTAENMDPNPLNDDGYIIIHYPTNETLRSRPYAIVVSRGSGSVRIARWLNGTGWQTK